MSVYNLKDLIRINQEIGEQGLVRNESSITFALGMLKKKKSWLYELSYLVRSIVVDHVFEDGNKRTAYVLGTLYFQDNEKKYDDQKLVENILLIAKKSIVDINKVGRLLLKC